MEVLYEGAAYKSRLFCIISFHKTIQAISLREAITTEKSCPVINQEKLLHYKVIIIYRITSHPSAMTKKTISTVD